VNSGAFVRDVVVDAYKIIAIADHPGSA